MTDFRRTFASEPKDSLASDSHERSPIPAFVNAHFLYVHRDVNNDHTRDTRGHVNVKTKFEVVYIVASLRVQFSVVLDISQKRIPQLTIIYKL